jgi:hypothetical protein
MDRLEDELRRALQERQPPDGFTQRVLARVPAKSQTRWFWNWRAAVAALSVVVVLVTAGIDYEHRRQQRLVAEDAKRKVLFAIRITQAKLQEVEDRLLDAQH